MQKYADQIFVWDDAFSKISKGYNCSCDVVVNIVIERAAVIDIQSKDINRRLMCMIFGRIIW